MKTRRFAAATLAGLAAVTLLAGCKKQNTDKDSVLRFIDATERAPREFTYVDHDRYKTMTVVGVVSDAFRYKARLSVDGNPAWEEVVSDDTVADRFDDPHILLAVAGHALGQATPDVLAQSASVINSAPPAENTPSGISPVDALRTGRWLVDPVGAPTIFGSSTNVGRQQGDDPIYDGVSSLEYVRGVAKAAPGVVKYNPDALTHPYNPLQDPFPVPKSGSGITRYDVALTPIPTHSASGSAATLSIGSFRKMAIYVKDGLVIEVREDVDVLHALAAFARNYQFPVPKDLTADQQLDLATQMFNRYAGVNGDKLRIRTMTLSVLNIGQPQDVALPTDNLVVGSASVLPYQGQAGPGSTQTGAGTLGFSGATTTTTAAPAAP